jgi:hypothetical protein
MALVALVIAIVLFVLATFTDGALNLTQAELAYLGLAFAALATLLGALPLPAWPRRD